MKYCINCRYQKWNGGVYFCYHHSLSQDHAVTGPVVRPRECEEMRDDPTLCGKGGVLFSEFVPPKITKREKALDFFFFHPIFSTLTGITLTFVIISALIYILK